MNSKSPEYKKLQRYKNKTHVFFVNTGGWYEKKCETLSRIPHVNITQINERGVMQKQHGAGKTWVEM